MTHPAEEFVERMGGALTQAGLPRIPSLVLCALLVEEDGQMSAAELAERLQLSRASISGAVRYLAQLGMVRRERERGSRRDRYVVDDDTWHHAMMRSNQAYRPMIAALNAGLAELPRRSAARTRLETTREFLEFVDQELAGIAERWEARQAASGQASNRST